MTSAEPITPRHRRWLIVRGLLRAFASATVMVALYYVLPLDRGGDAHVPVKLAIGIAVLGGVTAWQIRAIIHSRHPAIRATESLAVVTPLFLLFFAANYFILSRNDPAMFTEPLNHSNALYLTVTIFTTVGFGDISAKSETARLVVTTQMLLDLVVLGWGIQVLLAAVKWGRAHPDESER
ncbi:potassium channel family protein [Kribbella soli]|uniref:Two pore domain potassium channel family protein n=1 Tax=Kribbella soli TaxID=1124743 RepID=A0A4R0H8C5_9ACTN|nr:potassium channel family protein [Kribbella soli]TCC06058.1 two pore domain potassium channel family protein [Kribbella soli]